MTEVRVRSIRLTDGEPAALRDTPDVFDLGIDFTQPPDDIAAALAAIWQEAVDSGRWARQPGGKTGPDSSPT